MYSFIRGPLIQLSLNFAVIETQGIGFKILIPQSTYDQLLLKPLNSEIVLLHTSFVVRELAQTLYGFISELDRNLFELLMEISGVGPKTGLNLISHLPYARLQEVVLLEDIHALSKVPGIGKKTAERLYIELRNKLEKFSPLQEKRLLPINSNQKHQDALKALIHLGYKQQAAQKALKKCHEEDEDLELSALISSALKHIR